MLARLLASEMLPEVWRCDEETRVLRRRVSRRTQLIRQRTRAKNQVHSVLIRNLKGRAPVTDVLKRKGRRWLAELELPEDEPHRRPLPAGPGSLRATRELKASRLVAP